MNDHWSTEAREARVRAALRGVAEAGPVPDVGGAWEEVRRRAAERGLRRLLVAGAGLAGAAALVVGAVVLAGEDPAEDVAVGPAAGTERPATTDPMAATAPPPTIVGVPEHPLVVVTPDRRALAVHDAVTGARGPTLLEVGPGERIEDPHLSAGGRVLYTVVRGGTATIGGVLLDGTTSAADPSVREEARSPAEHGGLVAYVSGGQIRLADERGEPVAELAWPDGPDRTLDDLAFSPDGTRLAFTSRGRAYVVPTDAASLAEATDLGPLAAPSWRADGRLLALAAAGPVLVDVEAVEAAPFGPLPIDVAALATADALYALDAGGTVWRDDVALPVRAAEFAVPPPA